MKKKLLSLLLASTMALSVCGGLAACGEKKDDGLVIKVWCPDGAITAYEQMVKDYKTAHPDETKDWNVTFEAKGEGDAASAVRTDPATGPNIYFLASDQIDKNVAQGALQALPNNYVTEIQARDGAGAVDAAAIDGKYYAFPNANSNGYFLIYDTQFFTADDVKSLDTMVTKATASGKKIIFDYGNGFYNPTFFFAMGVGLGDTASNNEITLKTDKGYEAGKTFLKYFGTGANGAFTASTGNNSVAVGFEAGTVVAGVMGTWVNENNALYNMADSTDGWSRERIGFTKLPKFTDTTGKEYQMGSFMGAKYCGVNPAKSEAAVEASLALANFFNTKENQIKRYIATGDCPTNIEGAKDPRVTADPMLAALAEQNAAGGHMQLVTPDKFWEGLETFGNGVYNGETTAANINAAVDALDAALRTKAE